MLTSEQQWEIHIDFIELITCLNLQLQAHTYVEFIIHTWKENHNDAV